MKLPTKRDRSGGARCHQETTTAASTAPIATVEGQAAGAPRTTHSASTTAAKTTGSQPWPPIMERPIASAGCGFPGRMLYCCLGGCERSATRAT